MSKHCEDCGDKIDERFDFCFDCGGDIDGDAAPIDWDEQDRLAAASERIDNILGEY